MKRLQTSCGDFLTGWSCSGRKKCVRRKPALSILQDSDYNVRTVRPKIKDNALFCCFYFVLFVCFWLELCKISTFVGLFSFVCVLLQYVAVRFATKRVFLCADKQLLSDERPHGASSSKQPWVSNTALLFETNSATFFIRCFNDLTLINSETPCATWE